MGARLGFGPNRKRQRRARKPRCWAFLWRLRCKGRLLFIHFCNYGLSTVSCLRHENQLRISGAQRCLGCRYFCASERRTCSNNALDAGQYLCQSFRLKLLHEGTSRIWVSFRSLDIMQNIFEPSRKRSKLNLYSPR